MMLNNLFLSYAPAIKILPHYFSFFFFSSSDKTDKIVHVFSAVHSPHIIEVHCCIRLPGLPYVRSHITLHACRHHDTLILTTNNENRASTKTEAEAETEPT